MEQLSHFEAAMLAAGVTCVYNADDWERMADVPKDATPPSESSVQH